MLAAEIEARVAELRVSQGTDLQRAEIRRRLAEPARYADPVVIKAFFAQHGATE